VTTTLPRFVRNPLRQSADELVRVLPPGLAELVADDAASSAHTRVAQACSEGHTKVASLTTGHEQALADDEAEQQAAILAGRRAKPPKAAKIEAELDDVRHQLDVASRLLDESSRELLVASLGSVRQATRTRRRSGSVRSTRRARCCRARSPRSRLRAALTTSSSGWVVSPTGARSLSFGDRRGISWQAYRETQAAPPATKPGASRIAGRM
jgi:hypothetical protein